MSNTYEILYVYHWGSFGGLCAGLRLVQPTVTCAGQPQQSKPGSGATAQFCDVNFGGLLMRCTSFFTAVFFFLLGSNKGIGIRDTLFECPLYARNMESENWLDYDAVC